MREILFRGKDSETGKWVYGWVFGSKAKSIVELDTEYASKEGVEAYYTSVVIPETVGQCIGLEDKNGVKIFEGDVIRVFGKVVNPRTKELIPYNSVATVRYEGNTGCYLYHVIGSNVKSNFRYIKADGLDYEVIGNIHDNQELMENHAKNKEID